MSFILDALRKSEHDRQRDKGPGLVEVAVAPPQTKKNVWATLAVALLVVNLVAVGVLLIKRAGKNQSQAATTGSVSPGTPSTGAAGSVSTSGQASPSTSLPSPSVTSNPSPAYSTPAYDQPRVIPGTVPPVLQPALPADQSGGDRNPLADELSQGEGPAADGYDAGYGDGSGDGSAPAGAYPNAPGANGLPQKRGSVIYQTLPEADPITSPSNAAAAAAAAQQRVDRAMEYPQNGPQYPPQPPPGSVSRSALPPGAVAPQVSEQPSTDLPTADEIATQAGLPELHLDVHVYSTKASERFAFINGRRYKEGDSLQEGPHIDRITPEAVELSYHGERFALPRQ